MKTPTSLEDTMEILQSLGKLRELSVNPAASHSAQELQLVTVKYLCKDSKYCEQCMEKEMGAAVLGWGNWCSMCYIYSVPIVTKIRSLTRV